MRSLARSSLGVVVCAALGLRPGPATAAVPQWPAFPPASVSRQALQHVDRLYVEPSLVNAREMLAGALRALESRYPEVIARLEEAVRAAGITPRLEPVRGGTDGSRLTEMGMPTPNIFAGGVNFHGPAEWISTRVLAQSVCAILNLVQIYGEDG